MPCFRGKRKSVTFSACTAKTVLPAEKADALVQILQLDPRPGYQTDSDRSYGFQYAGYDIRFTVNDDTITVTDAIKL